MTRKVSRLMEGFRRDLTSVVRELPEGLNAYLSMPLIAQVREYLDANEHECLIQVWFLGCPGPLIQGEYSNETYSYALGVAFRLENHLNGMVEIEDMNAIKFTWNGDTPEGNLMNLWKRAARLEHYESAIVDSLFEYQVFNGEMPRED